MSKPLSAPSIQALRLLRCHGLNDAALQTAYRAIIVAKLNSKLTYATDLSPLTTAGLSKDFLGAESVLVFIELAGPLWRTLWKTVTMIFFSRVLHNENHIWHPLLPERNDHGYVLRRQRHERILTCNDDKRNFIYRQLHTNFSISPLSIVKLRFVNYNKRICYVMLQYM